jgi:SET domain-containing protein
MIVLKPSSIEGVGVFTTEPIKSGTLLPPMARCPDYSYRAQRPRGPIAKHCVKIPGGGFYAPRHPLRMSVGWYLNHADAPNIDAKTWRAKRRIRAGEELTINYEVLES